MKTNWKHMSAALLILAGTAKVGAVTTDANTNPGVVKNAETNAPAVQARGKKVFVNLLNLEGESVTVKVIDEENRLLYLKDFEESPVVEKAFNFEDAYDGTYSVIVNDGEVTYTAYVAVGR